MEATANPVTPELMNQALDEAHDECEHGCIHNAALNKVEDKASALIAYLFKRETKEGRDPIMGVFFFGLHVGYRLGQLINAPIPKEQVN